jgi:hypothetical protein
MRTRSLQLRNLPGPIAIAAIASAIGLIGGCGADRWETDYQTAIERARAEDKPLFLYFADFLEWDHHEMKRSVLGTPEARAVLSDVVRCELELRWNPEVARRYLVSSAPTYLLVDRAGNVCLRHVGPTTLQEFLAQIRQAKQQAIRAQPPPPQRRRGP